MLTRIIRSMPRRDAAQVIGWALAAAGLSGLDLDEHTRLIQAIDSPSRVDTPVVNNLAFTLASCKRQEDKLGRPVQLRGVGVAAAVWLAAAVVGAYHAAGSDEAELGDVFGEFKQLCAIRSCLSTATKHGKQFLEVLVMLAEGRPWLNATKLRGVFAGRGFYGRRDQRLSACRDMPGASTTCGFGNEARFGLSTRGGIAPAWRLDTYPELGKRLT